MKKPCDTDSFDSLRDKIIGLGEKSLRKSYYPELKQRVSELEEANARLKGEIQERKQAEEELCKSKADLEKAQVLANMGNWSWDIASDRLQASNQIYRILGIEKEACPRNLSQLIVRFVHPDDRVCFEKAAAGAIREKNFDPVECRIIRPDGEVRMTRTEAGELLLDEAGNPAVLNGITHDITRYRQAEEALRQSEERFQSLFNRVRDGVYRSTPDGRFVEFNQALMQILGYESREEVLNLDIRRDLYYRPEDRDSSLLDSGLEPIETYRLRRRDGREIWVEDHGHYVYDADGKVLFHEGILRDITERKRTEEALRESERLIKSISDNLTSGMIYQIVIDPQGRRRFTYLSDSVQDLYGISPRQGMEDPTLIYDKVCPDDVELLAQREEESRKNLSVFRAEIQIKDPSGELRWSSLVSTPKLLEDGSVCFNGIEFVITDRKRVENELRESQRFLADLIENSGTLISVKDREGRFEMVNRKWEEVTGLVRQDVLGRRDLELYPTFIADQFRRNDLEAMETGKIVEKEEVLENERGRSYLLSIKFPIRGNDNKIRGICGMSTEITDRKRAEETLRESEEMYRALIQALPDIVIRFDRQGRHLFISENAAAEFGISAQEHVGKTFAELGFPESSSRFCEEKIREVFESGVACEAELQLERSGRKRFLNWRLVPERDAQGRICSVLSVSRDVTDLHQGEEERKRLQEQLAQAQKMESVGRLAGGVAHDFNNMLAAILGHAEMALERVAPDHPLSADLRGIQNAAQRSADLTRQLLAFARKQTVMPRVLNLNDTVGGMLKMLGRLIGEDLELTWLPGESLWSVKMDPSQIDQVLANLCVNARDAIGKSGGQITIETGNVVFDETYCACHADIVPGEYVLLAVSDNGCGMDKQTQEHLFEPFFTTKGIGQGTGLGLATVYGVVKQNKGSINVYSEPGEGTTFKLYWPRYVGKAELNPADKAGALNGGRETVLMVEDEPAILAMCKAMVEKLGYRVIAAGTPGEAIRLAQEHAGQIHLLMTDVVMPEMNGRDLARRILSLYPDLKCLFMSGYTANVIAHHGVLDEGVQFLQKPFTLKDLSAKIRATLDSEQGDKPGK
ncbi:MAG TPA: PAS domain S-box protein [Candidatus Sumerlaeota bacterium]|nr:PAS domain S-box protein [Candidatus Sumerlaeota bacterium]HPS01644.1 PAS domain S-box protein [Candidatus Sumerlaeota bacterium]